MLVNVNEKSTSERVATVPETLSTSVISVKSQRIVLAITILVGAILFGLLSIAFFALPASLPLTAVLTASMVASVLLFGIAVYQIFVSLYKRDLNMDQLIEDKLRLEEELKDKITDLNDKKSLLSIKEDCVRELTDVLAGNQQKIQALEEKNQQIQKQAEELNRVYQTSRVFIADLELKYTDTAQQLQELQIAQAVTVMQKGKIEKEHEKLQENLSLLQEEATMLQQMITNLENEKNQLKEQVDTIAFECAEKGLELSSLSETQIKVDVETSGDKKSEDDATS